MSTSVLLSIKPPFADAIFDGTKRFEYRRLLYRNDEVDRVVVYASAPVGRVIGEFQVRGTLSLGVRQLWARTQHAAGIDRTTFDAYFAGCTTGHAIKIGRKTRFPKPIELSRLGLVRAPQSFQYLDGNRVPS